MMACEEARGSYCTASIAAFGLAAFATVSMTGMRRLTACSAGLKNPSHRGLAV